MIRTEDIGLEIMFGKGLADEKIEEINNLELEAELQPYDEKADLLSQIEEKGLELTAAHCGLTPEQLLELIK